MGTVTTRYQPNPAKTAADGLTDFQHDMIRLSDLLFGGLAQKPAAPPPPRPRDDDRG
jgi:hypothetical protein